MYPNTKEADIACKYSPLTSLNMCTAKHVHNRTVRNPRSNFRWMATDSQHWRVTCSLHWHTWTYTDTHTHIHIHTQNVEGLLGTHLFFCWSKELSNNAVALIEDELERKQSETASYSSWTWSCQDATNQLLPQPTVIKMFKGGQHGYFLMTLVSQGRYWSGHGRSDSVKSVLSKVPWIQFATREAESLWMYCLSKDARKGNSSNCNW